MDVSERARKKQRIGARRDTTCMMATPTPMSTKRSEALHADVLDRVTPPSHGIGTRIPCGPSSLAPQQVALLPDALVDFVKHGAGSTAGGAAA